MLERLIWVDYLILGVIALSILVSVGRGFMKEVLSLAAWIAAFIVAFAFVDPVATSLADYIAAPSVRLILAFGGLFLITLFLGGLVNILVAQLIQSTGLSGTDRMIGAVFGALRGVAIITVLVLLAGLTSLPRDPWWDQSLLLVYFEQIALWLQDFLPSDFNEEFTFL